MFLIFLVPPMLWIPHQLVGAPLAYSVTLECFTEAHPSSLNYWTREDGQMIHESRKYHTENIIGEPSYKTHMRLTINNIHDSDYGVYKCVAKNPRGETDGTIRLYREYILSVYIAWNCSMYFIGFFLHSSVDCYTQTTVFLFKRQVYYCRIKQKYFVFVSQLSFNSRKKN